MIQGIGVDTVSLKRFKTALKKNSTKFLEKICHKNEMLYLSKNKKTGSPGRSTGRQVLLVASSFACKEAVAKAFGTGLGGEMWFTDIEVKRNRAGAPLIVLHCKAKKIEKKNKIKKIFVSLTHEGDSCTAFVILEK